MDLEKVKKAWEQQEEWLKKRKGHKPANSDNETAPNESGAAVKIPI